MEGSVDVDLGLGHFVVLLPGGVVLGVYLYGEKGEGGEGFVDFAAEYVGGEGVEYPVALVVAGEYACEDCDGVGVEGGLEGFLDLVHECGCGEVGHACGVAVVGPCDFYADAEAWVVTEFPDVFAACDED